MKRHRGRYKYILLVGMVLAIGTAVFYSLIFNGLIQLNYFSTRSYSVRGVDVSAYQGDVDWKALESQGISFAYIKATEGSGFVDKCFAANYKNIKKTGIRAGAYHFFSFDSDAKTQADNYISVVDGFEGMLPPVVDLEVYGDKDAKSRSRAVVDEQLRTLLSRLEDHYGVKPMIYTTEESYRLYLENDFKDYNIWIRNVISKPRISDGRDWTFWQYSNRGRLNGYKGEEKFIDLNVFNGTEKDFVEYINGKKTFKN